MEQGFNFTEWTTPKLAEHLEQTVEMEKVLSPEYKAELAHEIAVLSFELLKRGEDLHL